MGQEGVELSAWTSCPDPGTTDQQLTFAATETEMDFDAVDIAA